MLAFKKAKRSLSKIRMAITGPSGSGKTYSSLLVAKGLGSKIAVIDTEQGSASLYSDLLNFDVLELTEFTPSAYIAAIEAAKNYDVLIIDSISQEWSSCLEYHSKLGGAFKDWAKITPRHNEFLEKIKNAPSHVICTMRSKMEHTQEKDEGTGRHQVKKLGLGPVQRPDTEYEFTLVFDIGRNHLATASKDRTGMFDQFQDHLSEKTGKDIKAWLESAQ